MIPGLIVCGGWKKRSPGPRLIIEHVHKASAVQFIAHVKRPNKQREIIRIGQAVIEGIPCNIDPDLLER
jgi:hypothetical protein